MMKDKLIATFKEYCACPLSETHREMSVKTQFMRTVFETAKGLSETDGIGKIRIQQGDKPLIIAWMLVGSKPDKLEYALSHEEYDDLKRSYFGSFEPDYNYLLHYYGYDKAQSDGLLDT